MKVGWQELTFTPTSDALDALSEHWSAVIGEDFSPLLFSALGDMFYASSRGVYWLNTGTGESTRVADSPEQFQSLLGTDSVHEWFMPTLISQLYDAGKAPEPGECFTPVILPVFAESTFTPDNFNPVPAREHFALTGHMHAQIRALPDGAQVKLHVGE